MQRLRLHSQYWQLMSNLFQTFEEIPCGFHSLVYCPSWQYQAILLTSKSLDKIRSYKSRVISDISEKAFEQVWEVEFWLREVSEWKLTSITHDMVTSSRQQKTRLIASTCEITMTKSNNSFVYLNIMSWTGYWNIARYCHYNMFQKSFQIIRLNENTSW
jgi:hypothetical protein